MPVIIEGIEEMKQFVPEETVLFGKCQSKNPKNHLQFLVGELDRSEIAIDIANDRLVSVGNFQRIFN